MRGRVASRGLRSAPPAHPHPIASVAAADRRIASAAAIAVTTALACVTTAAAFGLAAISAIASALRSTAEPAI